MPVTVNDLPANVPVAASAAPSAPAPVASPAPARTRANYAPDHLSLNGASELEAVRVLLRARQTNQKLDGALRSGAYKAEQGAKQDVLTHTAQQIHGEATSAISGLASKLVGAGAQAGGSALGTKMRPGEHGALGAGIDSVAQGGGYASIVDGVHGVADKLAGGAMQADQAKLALKQDDIAVSVAGQVKDGAKAAYDQDQKLFDGLLDTLKQQVQRVADLIGKVSG